MTTRDQSLDLWIETKVLHIDRSKRYSVGAYTRYPNKALLLLNDLEMPFTLSRRPGDQRYEITVCGQTSLADCWDDLAYSICLQIFQAIEGRPWPHYVESMYGKSG